MEILSTGLWERLPELKPQLGSFPAGGPGATPGMPASPASPVAGRLGLWFSLHGAGVWYFVRELKAHGPRGMAKTTFLWKLIKFTILTGFECKSQWQLAESYHPETDLQNLPILQI